VAKPHRLRQLRPVVAEVFELERLDVVLERLDEPHHRLLEPSRKNSPFDEPP